MLCHTTASALPVSPEQQCGMFFIITFDNHGYYMIGSWGSSSSSTVIKHKQEHIICQLLMWKSLLTLEWLKQKFHWCKCFYVKSGQVISRSQVQYLSGFYSQGTNHHFLDEELSDADKLISLLENQHHSHVLYHQIILHPN